MQKSWIGIACAVALLLLPPALEAQTQAAPTPAPTSSPGEFDGRWHTTVSPYVWLPGVNGTLSIATPALIPGGGGATSGNAQINLSTGPQNYLSFLNGGALVSANLRKGLFSVGADVIFLNLSNNGNPAVTISGPAGNVEVPLSSAIGWHVNQTIWEVTPGVTIAHGDAGIADVFAGVRNLSMTAAANWTFTGPIDLVPLSGQASNSATISDFIAGVRGKVNLGERWFVPYYADLGSGGSNSTYQYFGGIGYAQRWGNLLLFYRQLGYNQTNTDARLKNVSLGGLGLGVTFNL